MALTAEQIQEQLEAYFDSDEGKTLLDNITANISDEYTEASFEESGASDYGLTPAGVGNLVSYGDISLEDWQKQNIVTDGNNNTSLSNDQLTQLKTFAAMQPKYDPIKVGVGIGSDTGTTSGADRLRSEELRKTPGPIYTSFDAYARALQDHNKKIKTYIEDNKIPTSITTPDGTKLELNLGLTPVYYQEQRDGGRLQNVLHMNTDQGYYTQLGGVGQYGSYHRPKISQSKSFFEGFKEVAPFFAAFVGVAILGPMAAQYIGSTGMGQFLSTTSSKIIAAVKNAPATFKGMAGAINNTFQTLLSTAGVPADIASRITFDSAGTLAAAIKGTSYAEEYLDKESKAAIDAALASATGASGLPGGGVYSGPGAGPEGEINPNVIYNLTTGATTGADTTEEEDPADTIDATAIVNAAADAVATPDENEDVIAANTAVDEAETGLEDATNNVTTVVQEENAKVDSAKAYANYVRSRYGPFSFAYRSAKKRADKAELDAQNEINQARTAASVAQADFENAKKAAIGAQRDAEDEYKKAVAQARREAEAEVRNKIIEARAEAKAAAEARAAAKEAGISEAQDGYSDVIDGAGEVSYDDPETTDYADTTAGQEEVQEAIDEATGEKKEELIEAAEEAAAKPVEEAKPVVTTSDGTDAPATEVKYEESDDPIEVTTEVEPVEKPEDPPLEIEEPPKYPEKEEVIEETTETDAGGSGGGGAGEGAGAGAGAGAGGGGSEGAGEEGEETGATDIIAAQLREAIAAETDPKVKEGLQTELDKWLSGGPAEYQTLPEGPPAPDVSDVSSADPLAAISWVASLVDYFKQEPTSSVPELADTGTEDPSVATGGAGTATGTGTGTGTTTQPGAGEAGTSVADATGTGTGDADATGAGAGDADAVGAGTEVSDTPGAGAGDVGDPGDVGEGTGTGAGTGTGTGGGTGSGTGTGTGSGEGAGEGSGTGTGTGFGSQQLMQLLQPRRVQVESKPTEELKYVYDISGRYIPIEQYRSPFGLPSLSTPPQRTRPMGFKRGGLVSQHTDNISNYKEVGTVDDLLRILRDKR